MFEKQVKCRKCGFLAVHYSGVAGGGSLEVFEILKKYDLLGPKECMQRDRRKIAHGNYTDTEGLKCLKNAWYRSDYSDRPKSEFLTMLNSDRKCAYFFRHNPGYSPPEHKELQRERENRRVLLIGMLLAALLGAGAAIIAQLIAD